MYNSKKIVKKMRRTRMNAQVSEQDSKALSVNMTLAVDTNGAIQLLNGLAPGTAIDQRLGRQVTLDTLDLRSFAQVTPATGVDQYQRFLVVQDRQPNGAALTILDVLDTVAVWSQPNLANRNRFKILLDRAFHLNASAEPGSARTYHDQIRLGIRVTFNAGVAGTIADISTNSLYMLTMGNGPPGVTAGSLISACRCAFHNGV